MNLYIHILMYNRVGTTERERMTRERSKQAFKRPIGNPEETISEEPKVKKSRKNGSVEDNAKSKATDRDVEQSTRQSLR